MDLRGFSTIHFLHPLWLLALPPLLILVAWLFTQTRHDPQWSRIVDPELLSMLRVKGNRKGSYAWLLLGLVWTLAVVALAGPAWTRLQSPAFRGHSAWVLVLDLSPSMSATDLEPNRVTRARYLAADLLGQAHDNRVGLVVFAGESHTVTPLTSDVATVRMLLKPLAPGLMPESGDNLAPALQEAGRLLQAGTAQQGQIIVLSDGFADPAESLRVAQTLRQQGMTVQVVGIGTAGGAPQPSGRGGFAQDASGRTEVTRLQSDELQRLAAAGGGGYFTVGDAPRLLQSLNSVESREMDSNTDSAQAQLSSWRNEGVWLLPPLLLLAALLARRGWI
jgi:Ca-activated chloride channel family protein